MFKEKINKSLKKNWHWIMLILLAISFFIATSSFNYLTQDSEFVKWLSPDETANYTFIKYYGQENDLRIFEKYNLYASDIIHPRSFRSDSGELKPVSFLGMLLIYGKIVSLTNYRIVPYLTPFFGAIGLIFLYLLFKNLYGKRNAFISVWLLVFFPPYIYYCSRSMFHNVLFLVLLIIGLYFSIKMVNSNSNNKKTIKNKNKFIENFILQAKNVHWYKLLFASLGGLFTGLAIAVRSSELLWIAPLLIILWLLNFKQIGFTKLIVFLSFLYIALLPVFYWNQILYDFPYFGGYPEMNNSLVGITSTSAEIIKATAIGDISVHKNLLSELKDFIFFFGFQPRQSLRMFFAYFVKMFPWLFFFSVIGSTSFFIRIKKIRKKYLAYMFVYLMISTVLVFYYGSWKFHDNPDPSSITIGNSYTRYWLPIYIGAIPYASYFIMLVTRSLFPKKFFNKNNKIIKRNVLIKSVRVLVVLIIATISVRFVLYGSDEGLIASAQRQRQAKQEWSEVLEATEHNAVIITQYHDKLFFPERKVIYGLFNDKKMVGEYASLVKLLPVYYYNFSLSNDDINYLNTRRLAEVGLLIEEVKPVTEDFTLYRIIKNKSF